MVVNWRGPGQQSFGLRPLVILWTGGASPAVGINCGSPPTGIVGDFYEHAFPVTGGVPPYTFSVSSGGLPPGLTLNLSTGILTGYPTTAGTFPFTVHVVDTTFASASCSITIGISVSVLTARLFTFPSPSKMTLAMVGLTATGPLSLRLSPLNQTDTTTIPLMLFKNGLLLTYGGLDYSMFGPWITLTIPRVSTDIFVGLISTGGSPCTTNDGTITGAINGTNATFTLPAAANEVMLFNTGMLLTEGDDYVRNGPTVITLAIPPSVGEVLTAQIFPTSGPTQVTTFDGTLYYSTAEDSIIWRNGVFMTQTEDALTEGNTAALTPFQTPLTGDVVTLRAWTPSVAWVEEPALNLPTQFSTNDNSIIGALNGANNFFILATVLPVTAFILTWNGVMQTVGVDYTWACTQVNFGGPWTTTFVMTFAKPVSHDVLSAQVFFQ